MNTMNGIGKQMKLNKVSEYTILLEPKKSIDNDKTVYADFEKDLVELLDKYFFKEEYSILLSVKFK